MRRHFSTRHFAVYLLLTLSVGPVLSSAGPPGGPPFEGSAIVTFSGGFLPDLIYRKFEPDQPIVANEPWHLGFGLLLDTPLTEVDVSLSLASPVANIAILQDASTLTLDSSGLLHNYDPADRFELVYTGTQSPFTGFIDFILEPDGFDSVNVRVHLNVIDQIGYPKPLMAFAGTAAPLGNIVGDAQLEMVVINDQDGEEGLYAFDADGNLLPGWPLRSEEPDVIDQVFNTPTIADLNGDGLGTVIAVGSQTRNVAGRAVGFETTRTLYAVNGEGNVQWSIADDFSPVVIPALADIDRDGETDVLAGLGDDLVRISSAGELQLDWVVETVANPTIGTPLIAELDNDPANGLEIAACAVTPGSPPTTQLYVWNADGSLHDAAWPRQMEFCILPAVVDLDGIPENGRELVVAQGHDAPEVDPGTGFHNTFSVFAWHSDGSDVEGWPYRVWRDPNGSFFDDRVLVPVTAGDLDRDGDVEIIASTYGQGDPANGNLFVIHHDGVPDPNWPRWANIAQTPSVLGGVALADVSGDGFPEIVTGSVNSVSVFRRDGSLFDGFPRMTRDIFAQPTVADLDSDGTMEIVVHALGDHLYVWNVLNGSSDPTSWPQYRRNASRTGSRGGFGESVATVSQWGLLVMVCALAVSGTVLSGRRPPCGKR